MAVGIQIAGVYKVEDILPGMVQESLARRRNSMDSLR